MIETPNIIRPDTLGSCGRREVHRTPAFIGPRPDANIDDAAVREYLNDTASRVERPRNIRFVVKFPQTRGKVLRNELQTCPGRIEDR